MSHSHSGLDRNWMRACVFDCDCLGSVYLWTKQSGSIKQQCACFIFFHQSAFLALVRFRLGQVTLHLYVSSQGESVCVCVCAPAPLIAFSFCSIDSVNHVVGFDCKWHLALSLRIQLIQTIIAVTLSHSDPACTVNSSKMTVPWSCGVFCNWLERPVPTVCLMSALFTPFI